MEEVREKKWDSGSVGRQWQYKFFYIIIKIGGRQAAYLFSYFIVLWYVIFSSKVRQRCRPYLKRRFPNAGSLQYVYYNYCWVLSFAKTLIDRAVYGILGPKQFDFTTSNYELLNDLIDEGNGLVIVTAHTGNWQIAFSALEFVKAKVFLLIHKDMHDRDKHYFEHGQVKPPFEIIDPAGFLGGTVQMTAALQEGNVVGLMADRIFGDDRNSIKVKFLGGEIAVPVASFRIAAANKAPIAILFCHKNGKEQYIDIAGVIKLKDGLSRNKDDYMPYAEQFIECLEKYVKDKPFDYYNFFDVWDIEADNSSK